MHILLTIVVVWLALALLAVLALARITPRLNRQPPSPEKHPGTDVADPDHSAWPRPADGHL